MSLADGRALFGSHHKPATTAAEVRDREWTMEHLLANPLEQGRCLWASENGNTSARQALADLRSAVAEAEAEVSEEHA